MTSNYARAGIRRAPSRKDSGSSSTFLDLTVGRFRLALRASHVLGILQDVRRSPKLLHRGEEVPLLDLRELFIGGQRHHLPFVVAFEGRADKVAVAVGVDAVGHLRRGHDPRLSNVPAFGLARQGIFEGALRDGERLLLLLNADSLAALTRERRPEFDPPHEGGV